VTQSDQIKSFIVQHFANGNGYTTVDIAEFAARKDFPEFNTQKIGDTLRAWSGRNAIFRGFVCERIREVGHRDRFHIRPFDSLPGEAASEEPPAVTAPSEKETSSKAKSERFTGKILDRRDDGSFLVTGSDKQLYVVNLLKW
jgi:hypothetical protein